MLNEAEGIGHVIDDLWDHGFDDILVVDGYSKDGTADIAKLKGVRVLVQNGPGKAGAIKAGIKHLTSAWMLVMDGDGTYRARDVERLVEHAEGQDEVIGRRTDGTENIPRLNRIGNWIISKAFKLLFTAPITDVCSGMYILRRDYAKGLDISSTSFDIEVEIASQVAADGRIVEVPIGYGKRIGQQKLSSARHGVRIVSTLIWMANYYNPVILYSLLVASAIVPAAS